MLHAKGAVAIAKHSSEKPSSIRAVTENDLVRWLRSLALLFANGHETTSNIASGIAAASGHQKLAAEGITTTIQGIWQAFSGLAFTAADTNKDGTSSKQEFEEMMVKAGDTTAQADAIF